MKSDFYVKSLLDVPRLDAPRIELSGSRGYLANNSFPIDREATSAEVFEVISKVKRPFCATKLPNNNSRI